MLVTIIVIGASTATARGIDNGGENAVLVT